MKNNACYALFATALLSCQMASAFDGEISFTGKITSTTCAITAGNKNLNVVLPDTSTSALNTAGSTAGRTLFNITLSGCTATGKVSSYFEPGDTVDLSTNRLKNTAATNGATNVQLALLNDDYSPILVGTALASSGSKAVDIPASGTVNLNYAVEYYATGAATQGVVQSKVQYTLVYQ